MRIFVPIEDASIDKDAGVLVPYRYGLTCAHELRGALVLRDGIWSERAAINRAAINDGSSIHRPASAPACSPGRR
ncbi:MAG: hypothetical protein ABIW82_00965 [Dokdonella sp.]